MALNISRGKIPRAQKTVIYGPEGIGKTTLAAAHPDPLFIDTEGGSSHLDVKRVDKPRDWQELLDTIVEVANTPGVCKTLVIDTADWAEQLASEYVCRKYKQESIEGFGYGKGYTYLAEEFARFLSTCDLCIKMGINIVITAHAKMRKFEQPDEMGAYDRWETKLSKQAAPLLKEWCDHLLFCNYKTYVVVTDGGKGKGQGGKRVIYTSHHPAWDAKSRAGLPPEVEMSYEAIAQIYEAETPRQIVAKRLADAPFDEAAIMEVVHKQDYHEDANTLEELPDSFIESFVLKYWDNIVERIKEDK